MKLIFDINHDARVGNVYRQGVSPSVTEFSPLLQFLNALFPLRKAHSAEAYRPRFENHALRDKITVRYGFGEGVASLR